MVGEDCVHIADAIEPPRSIILNQGRKEEIAFEVIYFLPVLSVITQKGQILG